MKNYFVIVLSLTVFGLNAQQDSTRLDDKGNVVLGEVIIEKNKKIVLPSAEKVEMGVRMRNFASDTIQLQLSAPTPNLEWPPYTSAIPVSIHSVPNNEIRTFSNYLKLGYGNFSSPLIDVGINKEIGKLRLANRVFLQHFSKGPIDGSNSANSTGILDLTATYTTPQIKVVPFVKYDLNRHHFYGYTASADFIAGSPVDRTNVSNHHLEIGSTIKGALSSIQYALRPTIHTFSQKYGEAKLNNETAFEMESSLTLEIDKKLASFVHFDVFSSTYTSNISYTRSLAQFSPGVSYSFSESSSLMAGIIVSSSKSIDQQKSGIYPNLKVDVKLNENWNLLGYTSGGYSNTSLGDIFSENQFLDDSLVILNTETKWEIGSTLEGTLLPKCYIKTSLSLSSLNDLRLFVPSEFDSSRFAIDYANSTNKTSFSAEATYVPSSGTSLGASLELNRYAVDGLDRAWHLPTFTFKAFVSKMYAEKFIISANLISLGGIEAPIATGTGVENLKNILDIGINFNYLHTDQASFFVNIQNLLNKEYTEYIGYPVRGATFKLGGKYRF